MEQIMEHSQDRRPSPKNTDQRSEPAQSRLKPLKDKLLPHQVVTYSPLRTEQSMNASKARNAGPERSGTSNTVRFAATEEGSLFRPTARGMDWQNESVVSQPLSEESVRSKETAKTRHKLDERDDSHTTVTPFVQNILHGQPEREEVSTPTGRSSVQFARPPIESSQAQTFHRRSSSWNADGGDNTANERRGLSLFSKLKAFTATSNAQPNTRNLSEFAAGVDPLDGSTPGNFTPYSEHRQNRVFDSPEEEDSEIDADGEQSPGEEDGPNSQTRRKRKSRRPQDGGAQTAPTTPKTPFMRDGRHHFFSTSSVTPNDGHMRPSFLLRRATMSDGERDNRQGVSEDEGRDILASSNWRKGHGLRAFSYSGSKKPNPQSSNDPARPGHFKRALTSLAASGAASGEGLEGTPVSPWKLRGDRASSLSTAKWRQLKAGLKMLGQKRKGENTVDHAKSAELIAELTAGVPAALLLASMFQRDEHGNKRIPILLEQLKVKVTDSKHVDSKSGDRHMVFRIELEYGNGLTRMKWVVNRALRDFANLHARYKLQKGAQKYIQLKGDDARTKLPHFPKSTFPYLRGIRGLESESEGEDDLERDLTGPSGAEASGTERPVKRRRRPSMSMVRRKSSLVSDAALNGVPLTPAAKKDFYVERQRKKLEIYLQQMIRYLIFRPESNRLCKFLELSALGVRLAAEGSYHGKEGHLIIQSAKGVDFRRALNPSLFKSRHGPKWFLVRHSYVVCVDSPEEMNIYDVFLVDSSFRLQTKKTRVPIREQSAKDIAKSAGASAAHPQHHALKLYNSERKLKLLAKNERQLHQFEESIKFMVANTPWSLNNRFDSFAPVRSNVFARWLVDGRDYMWNVSRAISMAKDVILIHDWWLSPELYMRRPAAISQKWRLDRLLQRKAREGVKVFVIMYRNINSAVPIDSEYSKFSLLDLHPNIFVQRSPNQMRQGTFFWAHHEKICVVDHIIAFVGGIDLCFGRWDTPQHELTDDKLTGFEETDVPKDADHCQLWPGKDYSNPRVQDFYALDKPYEEMYDRSEIPRMPWHDISMQVVGQPARDLTRHFVQRWNYILRQRKPTRPTPFLIPPPDFKSADVVALGVNGTCEVQMLRSCCMWSMGTPDKVEHSIMNAYAKTIQQSDHFVYIENQFFVSSTETEGTRIENTIGDALVERIVRANNKGEDWRAVIMIPLMPGFQNTVDAQDGTSVRLIMQCQFRSICRGHTSIFGRLRAEGVEPEDYIQFYSLRTWGKIGPTGKLVTEQLYIHAKCMIVDDRVAIIGSANINERSMLGSRDSECAAVVRDNDTMWITMNGEPYEVGRFPHTLRMRLMREHLGLDVDEIVESEQHANGEGDDEQWAKDMDEFHGEDPASEAWSTEKEAAESSTLQEKQRLRDDLLAKAEDLYSFNHDVDWEEGNNPNLKTNKKPTTDPRVMGNKEHQKDVAGDGPDNMNAFLAVKAHRGRSRGKSNPGKETENANASLGVDTHLLSPGGIKSPQRSSRSSSVGQSDILSPISLPPPQLSRMTTSELGLPLVSQLPALPKTDDTNIGGPSLHQTHSLKSSSIADPVIAGMKRPVIDRDCMRDPLNDSFYIDKWHAVAENNTKIYRQVFRSMPDNEVKTWKEYKEYVAYAERFWQAQGGQKSKDRMQHENAGTSGPPGQGSTSEKLQMLGPIGETVGDLESAVAKLGTKIHERASVHKDDTTTQSLAKGQNIADDEKKAQAIRDSMTAGQNSDRVEQIEEKVTSRNSGDVSMAPTTSHASNTSQEPEKVTKAQTASSAAQSDTAAGTGSQKRRRRTTTRSSRREFYSTDDMMDKAAAEEVLNLTQGHLIIWPYDWLAKEEQGGNWLYSIDQLAPLEIYN